MRAFLFIRVQKDLKLQHRLNGRAFHKVPHLVRQKQSFFLLSQLLLHQYTSK